MQEHISQKDIEEEKEIQEPLKKGKEEQVPKKEMKKMKIDIFLTITQIHMKFKSKQMDIKEKNNLKMKEMYR